MDDTQAMVFHRQLFGAVDADCEADDCEYDTGKAIRALLAVIWIHCPAEWYASVMRKDALRSDGLCVTCGVRYPCRNIVAIADEFGLTWGEA